MERLVLLLQQLDKSSINSPDLYIVSRGEVAEAQGLLVAQKLRSSGFGVVELDLSGSAFGKQFKKSRSAVAQWLVWSLAMQEAENKNSQPKMASIGESNRRSLKVTLLTMTDELKTKIAELRS